MALKSLLSAAMPATNVLSHWYALFDSGHFSSSDFYDSIEAELKARKLPQLKSSRPEFHEGGALSDKRVYLRLERERYAFDVCAAPFGTGYFFSLRLIEKPRSIGAFTVILVLSLLVFGFLWSRISFFQILIGAAICIAVSAFILWAIREMGSDPSKPAQGAETSDVDSFVLNAVVIGPLYERVRRDTYHRYDTRLLFQSVVPEIVKRKAADLTAQGGVSLVDAYEFSPLLGEIYRAVKIESGK